jgi:hypothetical protein
MAPINYSIDVASPVDSAIQGYQAGIKLQDQNTASQVKQFQLAQQVQMQRDLAAFAQNPNNTAADTSKLMIRYPQMAEHFKSAFDLKTGEEQKDSLRRITSVYSALNMNMPDEAARILESDATAFENSGKTREAQAARALAEKARVMPTEAKNLARITLGSIMGIDKLAQLDASMGEERRKQDLHLPAVDKATSDAEKAASEAAIKGEEAAVASAKAKADLEKTQADVRNIDSEIQNRIATRADATNKWKSELQLKVDELATKRGEVPEDARKLVNTAYQGAIAKIGNADKSADLADRIESKLKQPGGLITRGWSATLRATGFEGDQQALQQEFSRLRNSNIMANLPTAFHNNFSNTDREFVEKGIPEESANPQYIAGFLRTMEKLLRTEAVADRAVGAWMTEVHHLGKTPRDLEIDGVRVPKGSSFADYATMLVRKQRSEGQASDVLKPYEKYIKK